jgi:alcohol dehydrogenase class IV
MVNLHLSQTISSVDDYLDSFRVNPFQKSLLVTSTSGLERIEGGFLRYSQSSFLECIVVDRGEPNLSSLELRLEGMNFRRFDNIVALGGGSVLDFAKAIKVGLSAPEILGKFKYFQAIKVPDLIPNIPLVVVPTNFGSGSEASSSALLINGSQKVFLAGESIRPNTLLLNSVFYSSMTPQDRGVAVADMLGHLIESFLSTRKNRFAEQLAITYLSRLTQMGFDIIEGSTYSHREASLISYFAGVCQDTMLVGPAHVLAHQMPRVRHGLGVGFWLRPLLDYYMSQRGVSDRLRELIDSAGTSFEELDQLLARSFSIHELNPMEILTDFNANEKNFRSDVSGLASPIPIDALLVEQLAKRVDA